MNTYSLKALKKKDVISWFHCENTNCKNEVEVNIKVYSTLNTKSSFLPNITCACGYSIITGMINLENDDINDLKHSKKVEVIHNETLFLKTLFAVLMLIITFCITGYNFYV